MREVEQIDELIESLPKPISQIPSEVYQYRAFPGFWSLLTSDSFWATNARFSNDAEEQRFGSQVLDVLAKEARKTGEAKKSAGRATFDLSQNRTDEHYILCFCKNDDKLSQWRGYARMGGCSIGFDLCYPGHYSLLASDDLKIKHHIIAQAADVYYVSAQEEGKEESEYVAKCQKELLGIVGPGASASDRLEEIKHRAPYVKHEGFKEEEEVRLVFHNIDGSFDDCIRYKSPGTTGIRIPYVVAKVGDPELNDRPCVVRVGLSDVIQERILERELRRKLPTTTVHACHRGEKRDLDETFCRGCMMRRLLLVGSRGCRCAEKSEYEIGLPDGRDCVFISQGKDQEEIHKIVYQAVKDFDGEIKVWCEGHLPIRSITVGPCENQEEVAESISYYCRHTYWLKDVTIRKSGIPFRISL